LRRLFDGAHARFDPTKPSLETCEWATIVQHGCRRDGTRDDPVVPAFTLLLI